jgi:hypothetical protein
MTHIARLPLIPVSPLIQASCDYAKELAQITQSLSEDNTPEVAALLEKNLVKEREKLDQLTKDMQTIQSSFLSAFNIYDIAKEIAHINCSLFRMVTLDKKWLCNFDKQSNMIPLLDFHRYISHSFAHQVIVGDSSDTVSLLVQLAYILLHVYRDFSGCTAILTSLEMPQVQRQQSKWSSCPAKYIIVYKELVSMLSPQNNYEAYHHQLWLHTARFLNVTPSKSQMIAVPFMHAHLLIIRNLVQTHSLSEPEADVVLSEAGQKTMTSVVHLLHFFQQYLKIDPIELEKYATLPRRLQSNRRYSITKLNTTLKLSTPVCLDLDQLRSNWNVYHWLVSRAYLSRSQLHRESLYVEPQAIGEVIIEAEEEYDLYWDFFHLEDPVKTNPPKTPVIAQMDDQITVDDLVIVTRAEISDNLASNKNMFNTEYTLDNTSSKVQNQTENENSIPIKPLSNGVEINSDTGTETVDKPYVNKGQLLLDNHDTKEHDGASGNCVLNQEDQQQENYIASTSAIKNKEESTILVEHAIEQSQANVSNSDQETNDQACVQTERQQEVIVGSAFDKTAASSPVPILSPTAPEFIPQTQSSTTTTSASEIDYMDNEDEDEDEDDDVIILTEEDEEDEDEDEEWTGYPIGSTPSQTVDTEEDEVWTGYPFGSQDEENEEDEEESWKGYPVPEEEDYLDSTISTPHEEQQQMIDEEEWKGYQKTSEEERRAANNYSNWNNNQLHAIGKAAARRMQYSFSNTDVNRKGLPSQFVPSTST